MRTIRIPIAGLLLVTALLGHAAAAAQTEEGALPARYTPQDKVYALSLLWSELKYNFVYSDRLDFDQDSLYRACVPLALATTDDVAFFELLKRYMARFDDGHTNILRYSYKWNDVYDFAPLFFTELDGRYYISELWASSGLDSLALGAELVRIEGAGMEDYARTHYYPSIAAGSERAKRRQVAESCLGTGLPGTRFGCTLRYRDGRIVEADLCNEFNRLSRANGLGQRWSWKGFVAPQRRNVELRWPQERIALLDFRAFDEEDFPRIDSLMREVADKAEGLIVDLRYCRGGASTVGDRLSSYLIDAPCLTDRSRTRSGNGYKRSQGNWRPCYEDFYRNRACEMLPADTIRLDRSKLLRCPAVILIGRKTVSAAETFLLHIVELSKRPPILGEPTEGSTGAPLVVDLPHGACARICTLCHLYPQSGEPFARVGIRPDAEIPVGVEDYLSGRDRVLEEALRRLAPAGKR